jgi:putative transposase
MAQSLSRVYVHITFSTKDRFPFIDRSIQERMFQYLGGLCKKMDCNPVEIGGYTDHVHILCLLSRKVAQMDLIEEVKKRSSKWVKTLGEPYEGFYWQIGYGCFSVNPSEVDKVIAYIRNQDEHHVKVSFQDEYRAFLHKYGVEYDERYIWD